MYNILRVDTLAGTTTWIRSTEDESYALDYVWIANSIPANVDNNVVYIVREG